MKKLIFAIFVLFLLGLIALSFKTYLDSDMSNYTKDKTVKEEKDKKDKNDKDDEDKKGDEEDEEEIKLEIEPLSDCNLEDSVYLTKEDKIEETKPFIYEVETVEGFNVPYININDESIISANKELTKLANYFEKSNDIAKKDSSFNVDYNYNKKINTLSVVITYVNGQFEHKEAVTIDLINKCIYTFPNALADNGYTFDNLKAAINKNYSDFTFCVETEDQLFNKVKENADTFTLGMSNAYADSIQNNICYYFDSKSNLKVSICYKILEGTGKQIKEITIK